jgi:hypothetical protein
MLRRKPLLLAALLVLSSSPTASAECAWVLGQ